MKRLGLFILFLWISLIPRLGLAHAIPTLVVESDFRKDGSYHLRLELDVRLLTTPQDEQPPGQPIVTAQWIKDLPPGGREKLLQQGREYFDRALTLILPPQGKLLPAWELSFDAMDGRPAESDGEEVHLNARFTGSIPPGSDNYTVSLNQESRSDSIVIHRLDGQAANRYEALLPGEKSRPFSLASLSPTHQDEPSTQTDRQVIWLASFFSFVRQGFEHVLPEGLDHILFVLGLFLLSAKWRPLLWQVTAFTIAHTVTLALGSIAHSRGMGQISPAIVEPIIAASIAYVAIENIARPVYSHWRLLVVFVFGLVHGLGFAGAMGRLPSDAFLTALLGRNIGVELAQLTVILGAWLLTWIFLRSWNKDETIYRRFVVIPGSLAIAATGLWWFYERVWG